VYFLSHLFDTAFVVLASLTISSKCHSLRGLFSSMSFSTFSSLLGLAIKWYDSDILFKVFVVRSVADFESKVHSELDGLLK